MAGRRRDVFCRADRHARRAVLRAPRRPLARAVPPLHAGAAAAAGNPDRDRAVVFYYEIGIGTKTVAGLFLGHVVVCLPFVFLQVTAALYNLSPALEEAARSLGAVPATAFRRITLPLIKPGVINGALFAFIISFDNVSISL